VSAGENLYKLAGVIKFRGNYMHIKIIKGKKYYYESRRIGKKVVSKYIGPVKPIRKKKDTDVKVSEGTQVEETQDSQDEGDFYIG
jgi:hypothetical protein